MPFGNQRTGFNNPGLVIASILRILGSNGGLFAYNPGIVALGNLVASVAATQSADKAGNNYFEGIGVYGQTGPPFQAVRIQETGISYYTSATKGGPWLVQSSVNLDPVNGLKISTQDLLPLLTNITQMVISSTGSGPNTSALLEVQGSASIGGTAANPTVIITDTWHSLGSPGAGWAVTRNFYRLTPDNELELDISLNGNGTQAVASAFANTLPAQYRPAATHDFLPVGTNRAVTAGDPWPHLTVTAGGIVTLTNSGTAHSFAFCGRIPLGAIP